MNTSSATQETDPEPIRELRRRLRSVERSLARGLSGPGGPGCCGVSLAQCHALLGIAKLGATSLEEPGQPAAEGPSAIPLAALGRELGIESSTLTRTLDGLETEGYVRRRLMPNNRRSMEVSLCEGGLAKVEEIDRLWNAWFHERLSMLDPAELRTVQEGIALLERVLKPRASEERACC